MATYTKIEEIGTGKLNNAEYTFFMQRTATLVETATAEKLGLSEALLSAFAANIEKMTDIVAQSRVSDDTARIAEVDKQADELIVYLMAAFRTAKGSPVAAQRTAGTSLYNATKPYIGCQSLPQGQQIQQMRGLLADLMKPEATAHLTTLGLAALLEQLDDVTATYANLLDSRAASQAATRLDAGKTVRKEMDAQYDDIATRAQAVSIVTPSAQATAFVAAMNKLIADTNAAYNQRIAQVNAADERKAKAAAE